MAKVEAADARGIPTIAAARFDAADDAVG